MLRRLTTALVFVVGLGGVIASEPDLTHTVSNDSADVVVPAGGSADVDIATDVEVDSVVSVDVSVEVVADGAVAADVVAVVGETTALLENPGDGAETATTIHVPLDCERVDCFTPRLRLHLERRDAGEVDATVTVLVIASGLLPKPTQAPPPMSVTISAVDRDE